MFYFGAFNHFAGCRVATIEKKEAKKKFHFDKKQRKNCFIFSSYLYHSFDCHNRKEVAFEEAMFNVQSYVKLDNGGNFK